MSEKIGFIVRSRQPSYDYGKMEIEFGPVSRRDLGAELAEAVKSGRAERIDYLMGKSKGLAEAAKTLVFFDGIDHKEAISSTWQDNASEPHVWYGFDTVLHLNEASMKLAAKFRKALDVENISADYKSRNCPRAAVAALRKIGAIPLRYVKIGSVGGEYVEDTEFDIDKAIPLPAKEAETTEAVPA